MGHAPVTIATNLNFSSLKNRIYMMNKTKHSNKHLLKFLLVLPTTALVMLAFRESDAVPLSGISANIHEEIFELHQVTYAIADPRIESIVHKEQDKSFLQAGKPFTITLIKRERDRLRSLLEQNGYDNITDHSISFLIDSSLVNNSFSVQVNIDLQKRAGVTMRNGRSDENVAPTVQHNRNHAMASMNNGLRPSASYRMYRQNVNTIHGGNFSMI
jgi:hypothetical protein